MRFSCSWNTSQPRVSRGLCSTLTLSVFGVAFLPGSCRWEVVTTTAELSVPQRAPVPLSRRRWIVPLYQWCPLPVLELSETFPWSCLDSYLWVSDGRILTAWWENRLGCGAGGRWWSCSVLWWNIWCGWIDAWSLLCRVCEIYCILLAVTVVKMLKVASSDAMRLLMRGMSDHSAS